MTRCEKCGCSYSDGHDDTHICRRPFSGDPDYYPPPPPDPGKPLGFAHYGTTNPANIPVIFHGPSASVPRAPVPPAPESLPEPITINPDGSVTIDRDFKETNPKDAVGVRKTPFTVVPFTVVAELGLSMLEGCKYGRHNYRVAGVRASVYIDAALGHLFDWWEGDDIDPASKLSHITKAMSSLAVLRDAMIQDMWEDDRPPKSKVLPRQGNNEAAAAMIDRTKFQPPFTAKGQGDSRG